MGLPDIACAMRSFCKIVSLLALLAATWAAPVTAQPVTVFAAASLKTALDEVVAGWDGSAVVSYGGSGTIARQVSMGGPADLVILANEAWMAWLEEQGGLAGPAEPLLGNALVVIGASGAEILEPVDLPARLGDGRLAIGHTMSVPAGIYGKAWLESEGIWGDLASRLAETENVRAALALVARQEAPLGVVYASDAVAEPRVSVVFQIPQSGHPPISYPVAITVSGQQDEAARLLTYLKSEDVSAAFLRHGFLPPPEGE